MIFKPAANSGNCYKPTPLHEVSRLRSPNYPHSHNQKNHHKTTIVNPHPRVGFLFIKSP
jgi:hypothetical protein